jgi:hypothetical protein
LTEKYQQLEKELVLVQRNEKQKTMALELLKSTTATQAKINRITQQNSHKELSDITRLQLNSLALLSFEKGATNKYLYSIYNQSRILARRLKQTQLYNYLQADKAMLSLSEVSLTAELHAILLNQSVEMSSKNNQVILFVDNNVQSDVRLDTELFSELIAVFVQLLLAEKNDVSLTITVTLAGEDDGQQNISFMGSIQPKSESEEEGAAKSSLTKISLPTILRYIYKGNTQEAESELLNYFYLLLAYQHGDYVSVILTEHGYQLSFTMPLAIMLKRKPIPASPLLIKTNAFMDKSELAKVAQNYQLQPIEVLLAARMPKERHELVLLLQAFGLQVTLVTGIARQIKEWQSGRYAVLITEFEQSPFIRFTDSLGDDRQPQRGVFSLGASLGHLLTLPTASEFSAWKVAELNISVNIADDISPLATLLSPWLKAKAPLSQQLAKQLVKQLPVSDNKKIKGAFDFESYIHNQGSVELALYMLDDYIAENISLVNDLTRALALDKLVIASDAVSSLLMNAKILSATELGQFCYHWQTLLAAKQASITSLSTSNKKDNIALQAKLLSKTKQEVVAISRYAQML